MTPQPETTRYEKLATFLESVMEDPKASRRVRLTAAQRLDDLVARQDRSEAAESRRKEREALRAAQTQQQASNREQPTPEGIAAREVGRERQFAFEQANLHLKSLLTS